jgi:hypothetical protein
MTQQVHPVLGIDRPDGECPKRCSKCSIDIPDEHVPLMLFGVVPNTGRTRLFVYCAECEEPIWPYLNTRGAA